MTKNVKRFFCLIFRAFILFLDLLVYFFQNIEKHFRFGQHFSIMLAGCISLGLQGTFYD